MMTSTPSLQAFNSTFNNVSGNQLNYTAVTVNNPPDYVPPQRVNDAPTDLLAANFMGRIKELDFLLQAFDVQDISTEEDVPTRCVVFGMPGLGKTKLVLRFAQIAFTQLLYSHVFWMSAASPDKLIEGMTQILDLVGHPERIRLEQNAKLIAARLWLEDSERIDGIRWLLILDNVDKSALEFLSKHLPRRNVKGNVLFTTRAADVADVLVRVSGARHSKLELRVPDLVEATHLLFSSSGIDENTVTPMQRRQAEQLVQSLGSLPLAVVQAASYMRQTEMTLDGMLQISKGERKIEMIEWESDLASDHQRSVVATFDTLFDQLERNFPETYDVLRFLSFLDPEDIPLAMLMDGARTSSSLLDQPPPENSQPESRIMARIAKWTHIRKLSQRRSRTNSTNPSNPSYPSPELRSLMSLLLSPTTFPRALHKLQSLSLVERLSRDGQSSLRMHDLVHFLAQEHVKRFRVSKAWLKSSVSLVSGVLQRVEDPELPQWWPKCEKLMPHIRSLNKMWTGVQGANLELVDADVRLARYLNSRGRYDDAERLCERSVTSFRKELGDKHNNTLSAYHILAVVHGNQGRFSDAEETYKHVLAVRMMELSADHEDTLSTMNDFALVYDKQGQYKEAEELHKRVFAVREKKQGPDHPDTVETMHNLASVYVSQDRYDEAEELLKHVLAHREKHLGPDHVNTLATANNLAVVYWSHERYIDTEELCKRVFVGWEKQLGPSHPDTLTAAWNLGRLYQLQARTDEAERLFLHAFTGWRQLGTKHPHILRSAEVFADFYRSLGRNSEANALLEGQ